MAGRRGPSVDEAPYAVRNSQEVYAGYRLVNAYRGAVCRAADVGSNPLLAASRHIQNGWRVISATFASFGVGALGLRIGTTAMVYRTLLPAVGDIAISSEGAHCLWHAT